MKTLMLATLLASISIYADDTMPSDTNLVILDQSFESQTISLKGKTYKTDIENYSYQGTCYDIEYDTYVVCSDSDYSR